MGADTITGSSKSPTGMLDVSSMQVISGPAHETNV